MSENKYQIEGRARAKQLATINPLTDEEKKAMLKVMQYFVRIGYNLPQRAEVMVMCAEFAVIYRPQGIQAMAAYLTWAEDGNEDYDIVRQTILHDLSERFTPFMSPRTAGWAPDRGAQWDNHE